MHELQLRGCTKLCLPGLLTVFASKLFSSERREMGFDKREGKYLQCVKSKEKNRLYQREEGELGLLD